MYQIQTDIIQHKHFCGLSNIVTEDSSLLNIPLFQNICSDNRLREVINAIVNF